MLGHSLTPYDFRIRVDAAGGKRTPRTVRTLVDRVRRLKSVTEVSRNINGQALAQLR